MSLDSKDQIEGMVSPAKASPQEEIELIYRIGTKSTNREK